MTTPHKDAPRVAAVRVRICRVPMAHPHQTASGTVLESPLVLTDITTDAGIVGHSIVFTYTAAALGPTADLVKNIEPLIKGDVLAPVEIDRKLSTRFRLLGPQGLLGMALSAIDMALWDAHARSLGVSLVTLLGGVAKPIQAYGAVGYAGVKGSAETAEDWAKRGLLGVKAKIGYPTVQEDVAVIRAMRHAIGDSMAIMVDYNQSLAPADAIARVRILDDEGVTWVEEPTLAHDYKGHADIARAVNTPIQCGENWWGPTDMQHAIDANASDFMMADVMKIGGVTGWLRAAAMTHAHGIRLSSHLWPEISARLFSISPTAHWLEYADWWNPVLLNPLVITRGMALADDSVGSGIEWNERAIQELSA